MKSSPTSSSTTARAPGRIHALMANALSLQVKVPRKKTDLQTKKINSKTAQENF
ncbi:hypothetical protein [Exilibacterium tricleocarpae]|uniref:hypothetical protein n=1 Tax=Exilibacterium tricleocarpae TaxID=2591008 RepID=UPI0015D1EC38|nr:hypothetical protein [Exilibacterium tricleocarpae]